jgi:hypothetical protein
VITPGRAGCTFDGATAGTGLAVRTEMAIPIVDVTAGEEAGRGIAGVDPRTGVPDAGVAEDVGGLANNGPASNIVFPPPSHGDSGSLAGGAAGTG